MFVLLVIILPLIAGCIGYRFGYINGQSHEHVAALMAGVGDWERDPEDGEYRFRYGVRPPLHRPPEPPAGDEVGYAHW
jgi:hypothetical protein